MATSKIVQLAIAESGTRTKQSTRECPQNHYVKLNMMVSTEDQADKTVLGVTFLPADLTPFKEDRDTSISCNKEADIFF